MKIERKFPENILPCSTNYRSDSQPYYIVAPNYGHQSAGVRLLHEMCSLLNQMGYESYVEAANFSGNLWTPRLSDATKIAHHRAGKTPIVIYPEVVTGLPLALGLPVRYVLNYPGFLGGEKSYSADEVIYTYLDCYFPGAKRLYFPLMDLQEIGMHEDAVHEKSIEIAYYHNRYTKSGGKVRDFGPDAVEISSSKPDSHAKTLALLKKTKVLYCYEFSGIIFEATLCGCMVVMLPNAISLKEVPLMLLDLGMEGVAWGEDPEEIARAKRTLGDRPARYLKDLSDWKTELNAFIEETQSLAKQLPQEKAWPQKTLDKLPFNDLSAVELAERADRRKYRRLNEQYEQWVERCTLREIDADIYAEHLACGNIPGLCVLVDHRNALGDDLADTLDSLAACLGQPVQLIIVSELPTPDELQGDPGIQWITVATGGDFPLELLKLTTNWILLVKSGARLAPQSLMEWGLSTREFGGADLVYADDDKWSGTEQPNYPFFKPDANIELLRCSNYLGEAVLARASTWLQAGGPLGAELYAYALQCLSARGRVALGHVDTILSHTAGHFGSEQENQEYLAAHRALVGSGLASKLQPQSRWGTWLVEYKGDEAATVSLVVSTGLQTGYLRSLMESLQRYPQANLLEIILVTSPEQVAEVEYALSDVSTSAPWRILELKQDEYSHSKSLNLGIASAVGQYILVCDDDTEMLHANWLMPMLGLANQSDVGCVAPRLMTHRGPDARLIGGPLVLGINGTAAPYNGEEGRLEEAGVYSRLQLTQDVGAVSGHCFLFRREQWESLGGFDEKQFYLWFPVLDFCLRLAALGKRHIWTPLSSVLHQGGKTVASVARDARLHNRLAERELTEKEALLAKWARALANDACYNRHLSLTTPFDVESNIVIDWQPRRRERPRLLAIPLTSGAGQYRIIEPLEALQNASLAQTCAVIPLRRGVARILQPLELVRAAPDKLILQHSVDDAHLTLISKYRLAMPDICIVQMVDDLLGEVPEKHPNRVFQMREGHQRMIQALKQSDMLVVTTEPLAQYYKKYVKDVRLVPNALDKPWLDLRHTQEPTEKLRIGWIGAAQHKGDLDLIADVVKQLADDVDWVFMGMCTDEITPHLKEFHGFVSISDYPKKMSELNLDIAIAPLEDNMFNECKSNLRLLEYGAMGWPVVCSDVFPYRTDAPPVIRCANDTDAWVKALRGLMADADLRARMGSQLHDWVNSHYLLSGMVQKWKECLID